MHVELLHIYGLGGVEEPRPVSELKEPGLAHRLLDDDVEDLAHGLTVLLGVNSGSFLVIDLEFTLDTHVPRVDQEALVDSLGCPNVVS